MIATDLTYPRIKMPFACRPHPNECSGGDLDGDLYFISWDEKIIPPQTVAPMDYTASRPRIMDHDVTLQVDC